MFPEERVQASLGGSSRTILIYILPSFSLLCHGRSHTDVTVVRYSDNYTLNDEHFAKTFIT